jgi:hypothetical protein
MDNEIHDTTPDRRLPHPPDWRALSWKQEVLAYRFLLAVFSIAIIASLILSRCAHAAEADPVFEHKVAQCADYIGVVNFRLQDGRHYKAARILVTASKEAKLGWGWELLAAIARFETGEKFNPEAVNSHGCYGLLQIHDHDHFANMRKAGLNPPDPYDTVLWGATMLAISQRKGMSLYNALEPWSVRGEAIKEYERIKGLYR